MLVDELPAGLLTGAHGRRRLLLAGVSPAELRGPLWDEVLPGRHAWTPTDPSHPRQRALVAASAIPLDAAVGGWAAAYLLGAHGLDGSTPDPDVFEPVLLCLPRVRQRPWWDGVRPFRSDLGPHDVVEVDGARVTSAVRTAFDLGRLAPSLIESVVVLDAVTRDLGVGTDAVARYARQRPRWRGLPRLRAALELADPRSRSPQETRFRMLWVLEAGLDAPRSNWPVLDLDGHLLGEVDLLDVRTGVVGEYDGAHHADAEQRAVDNARHEALERHGLRVVRVTATDLARRRRWTVSRLRSAADLGPARDPEADRWVPGRPSSVSPLRDTPARRA